MCISTYIQYTIYNISISEQSSHFVVISHFSFLSHSLLFLFLSFSPLLFSFRSLLYTILLRRVSGTPVVFYSKQSNLELATAPTCDCQVTIYIPGHLYNNLLTRYIFLARCHKHFHGFVFLLLVIARIVLCSTIRRKIRKWSFQCYKFGLCYIFLMIKIISFLLQSYEL